VRRRSSLAATIALVVGVGAGVSLGPVGASAVASAAKKPANETACNHRVVHASACNKGSTIGTEGCEEHQLVTADKRIDREVSVLFALLHDDAARSRLVRAETAWFAYRQADSASQADIYEGGSESAVVAVLCATNDDKARSTDLYGFFQGLELGRSHVRAFP